MKRNQLFTWFVLLIVTALMFIPFINVKAHPTPSLTVTPNKGKVGDEITVSGTIDTENGSYRIFFDGKAIFNGTAEGKNVTAIITVPDYPAGPHQIKLLDLNASTESSPVTFTIVPSYLLKIYPESRRIMEGQNLNISIRIVGGEKQTTYNLNLTVKTPTNKTYYHLRSASTDEQGHLSLNITYPDEFSANANTNYTGVYIVKLNETEIDFTVGITDKTDYHRNDIMKIQAAGYIPGENATITITFPNETKINLPIAQALENGTVKSVWTVPKSAPMGNYTIEIIGNQTGKTEKPDIQIFTIPGRSFNITALNLNMEPVPDVMFRIYEKGIQLYNITTGTEGKALAKLEVGNYTFEAIYKDKLINITLREFRGEKTLDFSLPLVALNLTVLDGRTFAVVPFTEIEISLNYTSVNGENRTLTLTNRTDILGSAYFRNVFVNESYLVKARKYGTIFNMTYLNIPEKPETGVYDFSIYTPKKTLIVTVLNSNGEPASNINVKVYEWTSGTVSPLQSNVTNDEGKATLPLSFGWYKLRVFKENILVNETKIELTSENQTVLATIHCKLLDLNLTVKVLDYFGFPIPQVKVVLDMNGVSYEKTGNGEISFKKIIGGNCKIFVFLPSDYTSPYIVKTFYLCKSETVTLRDENHINFFGALVETRMFATITIVVLISMAFAAILIYRSLTKK